MAEILIHKNDDLRPGDLKARLDALGAAIRKSLTEYAAAQQALAAVLESLAGEEVTDDE